MSSASFLLERVDPIFHSAACLAGTFDVEDAVLLAFELVVVDEELNEFLDELLAQVVDVLDVSVAVIHLLDGDDAIVAVCLLAPSLLALDDADGAAFEKAAGKGGLVHQHQNVGRITVFRERGRDESKIVGKGHASGQNLREFKYFLFRVERIFVAASFRSFDNDLDNVAVIGVERRESGGVGETSFFRFGHTASLGCCGPLDASKGLFD